MAFSKPSDGQHVFGQEKPSSYIDEKSSTGERDGVEIFDLDSSQIGDVFSEGPRLIDIGKDGKERPIGMSCHHSSDELSMY